MIEKIKFTIGLFLVSSSVFSQFDISDEGKHVYFVDKENTHVESVDESWKIILQSVTRQQFISKANLFIYLRQDTLFQLDLYTKKTKVHPGIKSYSEISYPWFMCRLNTGANDFVCLNIIDGKRIQLDNIREYKVSADKRTILLKQEKEKLMRLLWMPVGKQQPRQIWSGQRGSLLDVTISQAGSAVAFVTVDPAADSTTTVLYWSASSSQPTVLVKDGDSKLDPSLKICNTGKKLIEFNRLGNSLLFYQQEKVPAILKIAKEETQVWSYLDAKVYPYQEYDAKFVRSYATAVNVNSGSIIRLEHENDLITAYNFSKKNAFDKFREAGDFVIVRRFYGDVLTTLGDDLPGLSGYVFNEFNWNKMTFSDVILTSLKDGKQKSLIECQQIFERMGAGFNCFLFSPSDKYIVYYDFNIENYVLYEMATGDRKNFTSNIDTRWTRPPGHELGLLPMPNLSWLPEEKGVVIMDGYNDVWKINFRGNIQPRCITQRYGRDQNICMPLPESKDQFIDPAFTYYGNMRYKEYDESFLSPGYCQYKQGVKSGPEILLPPGGDYDYDIKKARKTDVFIVSRNKIGESSEILLTTDFRKLRLLQAADTSECRLAIRKEIITWKTYTNKIARGFLYKPANFDVTKKYPVIIKYYEYTYGDRSFELQETQEQWGNYLKRGYLVFLPEIRHSVGEIGSAAYDFVVSGAENIALLSYVNSKKMGIMGHSFGATQTNFLVTQTNLFAAAVSNSGMTNLISDYGAINEFHRLPAASNEVGQTCMGTTPWIRPDLYIKNSPIFYADRVSTPLLLSHSQDDNVPLDNSVQMFMALRRLGKRVWLLSDNRKTHGGSDVMKKNNVNLVDQFLDHYLKDTPAPRWMLEGIPARLRGVESCTELDSTGKTPGPGIVMATLKPLSEEHAVILSNPTVVTRDGKIESVKKETSAKVNQPKQQPDEKHF